MSVDSAEGRKSAYSSLLPFFISGVDPGPVGIDVDERQAAAHVYSDIQAANPVTPPIPLSIIARHLEDARSYSRHPEYRRRTSRIPEDIRYVSRY